MKFSIRELILVTVIVSLAVGWWVDRAKINRRLIAADHEVFRQEWILAQWEATATKLRDLLRKEGWSVEIDEQGRMEVARGLPNSSAPAPNPPRP